MTLASQLLIPSSIFELVADAHGPDHPDEVPWVGVKFQRCWTRPRALASQLLISSSIFELVADARGPDH